MWHTTTTISERRDTHFTEAAMFWILAGILVVIAFGDFLTVLAAAFAIAAAISWIYRAVEHRLERNGTDMASVRHLRPASTGGRDLENPSAESSWHGTTAA